MNTTQTLLKNLTGGQLQRLAMDLLSALYKEWGRFVPSGSCEGGYRTRKGTPDIWCENDEGQLVYIQATADSSYGKMLEDTKKSIAKLIELKKNESALCVSFLNYEPDSKEVEKCKAICSGKKCRFIYFTNSQVVNYLDTNFPMLKEKYIGIQQGNSFLKLKLDKELYFEEIDYLSRSSQWIDNLKQDLSAMLKEYVKNAYEHGCAKVIELAFTKDRIVVFDDGLDFNLLTFSGTPKGNGGGLFMVSFLNQKYKNSLSLSYHNEDQRNVFIISNTSLSTVALTVSQDCSIQMEKPKGRGHYANVSQINIPEHCTTIRINIDFNLFIISDFVSSIHNLIKLIPDSYRIEIYSQEKIPDYFLRFFEQNQPKFSRVIFINIGD